MKKLLIVMFLLAGIASHAQNRISETNNIGWYAGTVTLNLSEKWGIHNEYQWRRTDYIENWQQGLLRVGVNYKPLNGVLLRAGYAWAETYAYGGIPLNRYGKDFTEHRTFEMVQLMQKLGSVDVSHRFMLEQRWVGRYNSAASNSEDGYNYMNRLRYMARIQVPVYKKLYVAAYDEIFIGFGKKVGENIFDQNRLGLLAGCQFTKEFRAEAGYLNQIVQLGREINGSNVFQHNSGFIVSAVLNLDLYQKATVAP